MNFDDGLVIGLAVGKKKFKGKLDEKEIVKNGTYLPKDDELDGYNKVIVKLPLDSKFIIKNGIYYAKDDELEGYSVINVNVRIKYDDGNGEIEIEPGDDVITPDGVKSDKYIWKFTVESGNNPWYPDAQNVLCTVTNTETGDVFRKMYWPDDNAAHSYNVKILSAVNVSAEVDQYIRYEVTIQSEDLYGNVYISTKIFTQYK